MTDTSGSGNNKPFKTGVVSGAPYQYISASLDLTGLDVPSEGVTLYFRVNDQLVRVSDQVVISEVVLYSNPGVDATDALRFRVGGALDTASPVEPMDTWGGPSGNSPDPVLDTELNDGAVCYFGRGPGASLILAVTIEPDAAVTYRTVAGGQTNADAKIMYSDDGINWTEAPTGSAILNRIPYAAAFNGTEWLIGGSGQADPPVLPNYDYCAARSVDGITWTNIPALRDLFYQVTALVWTGTKWIAGGINTGYGNLAYSNDAAGTTWTIYNTGSDFFFVYSLASNGSITVAAIVDPAQVIPTRLLYLEGSSTTWSQADSGGLLLSQAKGVAWNGTKFIAVGSGVTANMVSSTDGKNWTAVPSAFPLSNSLNKIAWNGALWVAVGEGPPNGNSIIYSSDGVNWTVAASANSLFGWNPITESGSGYVNNVCWNGSVWIAVGYCDDDEGNPIRTTAYSPDGSNWFNSPSGFAIANYEGLAVGSVLVPGVGVTASRATRNGGGDIRVNSGTLHVTMKLVPRFG